MSKVQCLKSKVATPARSGHRALPRTVVSPLSHFAMWRSRLVSGDEDIASYAFVFRLRRIESDRG